MSQQNTSKFGFGYGWNLGENPGTIPLDEMRLVLDSVVKMNFGYNPILSNGLSYHYFGGALFDQYGAIHFYNAGSIVLTTNTTNYVYRINELVSFNTTGFPADAVPLSIVITDSNDNISSVQDVRPSELTATQLRFISDNTMLPTGTIKSALDLAGTYIKTLFDHFGSDPNAVFVTTIDGTLPIVVNQSTPGTAIVSINPATDQGGIIGDPGMPGSMSAAHFILVNSATDQALGSTLVKRDSSGNFSANFITASLVGTASNTSALENNNAAYYLNRANHTGMQPVSTITSFAYTVQSYSLDLFAVPQSSMDFNSQRLINLGTPTNGSDAATKDYADGLVVGLLDYRGSYDASGNVFPTAGGSGIAGAVKKGDIWFISVPGTLGGSAVLAGYSISALIDAPGQTIGNWNILNVGLGYIPQQQNTDLSAIAALTPSNDDILQRKSGAWTNRTIAQLQTDLGLGTAAFTATTAYQAASSDLAAIAALTPSNNDVLQRKTGVWVNRTLVQLEADFGALGSRTITSSDGSQWIQGSISEAITLSTSGTTTDSVADLLLSDSIIEAVVAKLTNGITVATDWALGDASSPARFMAANSTLAANTKAVGLEHVNASTAKQTAAAKLRITTTGIPGAGIVQVTVFYRQFVAPI